MNDNINFEKIEDKLYEIRMAVEDVKSTISSFLIVVITIFLITEIFRIKLQINQIDFQVPLFSFCNISPSGR